MSRSLQEWKLWDERTVAEFQRAFLANFKKRGVIQAAIARELKLDESEFNKWLHEGLTWSWIGEKKYRLLVDRAAAARIIVPGKALRTRVEYTGIASFFGQEDADLPAFAKNASGHYAVYRYSRFKPGSILIGGLQVTWSPTERIVSTKERYRAVVDGKEESWPRSGYMSERSDGRLVMLSRKNGINEPQIMYLNRPMVTNKEPNLSAFSNVDGVLIDWQGDSCYAARVVLVRRDIGLTPAEVRDSAPEHIDKWIVERLSRPIQTLPKKSKSAEIFDVMCLFD